MLPVKFSITEPGDLVCIFCKSSDEDETLFGPMECKEDVAVHYNCLLSASCLSQKVDEDDDDAGIKGFLVNSIKFAAKRGRKEECVYCGETAAVVGCCDKRCRRMFHYPCGLKNGAITKFFGTYNSYCDEHADKLQFTPHEREGDCPVCSEELGDLELFKSPCCSGIVHMECVRKAAYNAGTYVLKCMFCQDIKQYVQAILKYSGIYIPTREATYESHDQMVTILNCCAAFCPDAEMVDNDDHWSLIKCVTCGSRAMHARCAKLMPYGQFQCPDCGDNYEWVEDHKMTISRRGVAGKMFHFEYSSLSKFIVAIHPQPYQEVAVTKSGRSSKRNLKKEPSLAMKEALVAANAGAVRFVAEKKATEEYESSEDEEEEEITTQPDQSPREVNNNEIGPAARGKAGEGEAASVGSLKKRPRSKESGSSKPATEPPKKKSKKPVTAAQSTSPTSSKKSNDKASNVAKKTKAPSKATEPARPTWFRKKDKPATLATTMAGCFLHTNYKGNPCNLCLQLFGQKPREYLVTAHSSTSKSARRETNSPSPTNRVKRIEILTRKESREESIDNIEPASAEKDAISEVIMLEFGNDVSKNANMGQSNDAESSTSHSTPKPNAKEVNTSSVQGSPDENSAGIAGQKNFSDEKHSRPDSARPSENRANAVFSQIENFD